MKVFVNGDEIEFGENQATVVPLGDRLMVHGPEGTFSAVAIRQGDVVLVSYRGLQYRIEKKRTRSQAAGQTGSGELRAPMPGQIVDVRRLEGDLVKKGETVLVLEAMKTQQPFNSPFDGRVSKVLVAKGDQVTDGMLLAVVELTEKKDG